MILCRFGPSRLSPSLSAWQVRQVLLNTSWPASDPALLPTVSWPRTPALSVTRAASGSVNWRKVMRLSLDSSLRDVKQDESNNEVAPSRGDEQIDDVLDGLVGAVVGGFKSAVWAILRVRTAVEAAVGKWSAQPFVEEQK